jgi:hypothetical protein
MKVLSIDVGIKNLAFCLLEKTDAHNSILKWDSINVSVSDKENFHCCELEKNKHCNKPAKFFKDQCYYCAKHSKKQTLQIPTAELSTSYINKQKIQKLLEMADKYNIKYNKPIKKQELVAVLNEYIQKMCFETIKRKNASKTDLITIGKNIKTKFDELFKEENIDVVIIENQISPIANRMKTIQGMIAQYFIMKKTEQKIEFISAANKLKSENGLSHSNGEIKTKEKTKYADRKKQGIQKCLELLNNDGHYLSWMDYFKNHGKKDDLADSLLQGLWYIKRQ